MPSEDNTSPPPYEASPPNLPHSPSAAASTTTGVNSQGPTQPIVYFLTPAAGQFIPSGNPNVYASTNTSGNNAPRHGSVQYVQIPNSNQPRIPNAVYVRPDGTLYPPTNVNTTSPPTVIVNVAYLHRTL
ncbi:378_t:CDS:2 [Paraglomus occultum]|uniref:378_t:CDS:1 n=1 Tax=Paraglomus occultum TaxID=144539 RepID=A0A9N9F5M5_9GLOM|nr:378_t:CDS:2 [Paraglomus occultum]